VLAYVKAHGGGTIAVSSQSSAAGAIISDGAQVAGIGGFSGRESSVSVNWLAQRVREGKIRWVLDEEGSTGSGSFGGTLGTGRSGSLRAIGTGAGGSSRGLGGGPGDSRAGSRKAIAAAATACVRVSVGGSGASSSNSSAGTLYDCRGRAAALEATAS
jgi:hypothetical protein